MASKHFAFALTTGVKRKWRKPKQSPLPKPGSN
jgi:hypothetical protein